MKNNEIKAIICLFRKIVSIPIIKISLNSLTYNRDLNSYKNVRYLVSVKELSIIKIINSIKVTTLLLE